MKRRNRVAFFNLISIVLLQGISFFSGPIFLRLLGDNSYGISQVYTTWVGIINIVFTLQTYSTLANARVEFSEEEQKNYQSSVMSLSLLMYAIGSGAVLVFLKPIAQILKMDSFFVCLLLFHTLGSYGVNFLNIRNVYEFKAGQNVLLSLITALSNFGLSVVLILQMPEGMRHYGRILAAAGTYIIIGSPLCIWILVRGKSFFCRRYWKFCIALALPTAFYNLSDLILGQSDKVMLQQMLSNAAAGQYSAALNFAGFLFVLFHALNNSWCPFFFEDKKLGETKVMEERAKNFLELFTVLSVGFNLLMREVYLVFAGGGYREGTDLIPVFVTSYFLNFLCTFPINYEFYYKKTKVVAAVTIFCSLLNIVLNYFLIQAIGAAGAAIATALSHGVQLALHYGYARFWLGKQDYPFGFAKWAPYAGAYAGIMALTYLARDAWLLRWGLGAAIGVWELWQIRKRKVLI